MSYRIMYFDVLYGNYNYSKLNWKGHEHVKEYGCYYCLVVMGTDLIGFCLCRFYRGIVLQRRTATINVSIYTVYTILVCTSIRMIWRGNNPWDTAGMICQGNNAETLLTQNGIILETPPLVWPTLTKQSDRLSSCTLIKCNIKHIINMNYYHKKINVINHSL